MTEFVLNHGKIKMSTHKNIWRLRQILNYANFLSQKLELWIFVPCKLVDSVWVVLEEPHREDYDMYDDTVFLIHLKEYQEAKERCLFEGFELKGETDVTWIFKHNNIFPIMIQKERNIEYLNLYFKVEITLTPTAKKQIGL